MSSSKVEEPVRILVVDDEHAIRYSVTKNLQRMNYRVDAVASAEEALELLKHTEYDVVLTDIRMAGISGVELLAQTREMYPDASVILMTGYADMNTAIESLRLGANDYLKKPISSRDIRESVGRGVERAQAMRRRRKLLSMIQASVEELNTEAKPLPLEVKPLEEMEHTFTQTNSPQAITAMELGEITLFPGRYQILVSEKIIDLTPTEFDLLLYLAAHRGRVVSCGELVREVRGYPLPEDTAREVIRPHISNLRRKIKLESKNGADLIVNVRGVGYRLSQVD